MTAQVCEAERLEALARRPLQPRREVLLHVAARLRALAALQEDERPQRPLDLDEEAAA